MNNNQEKEYDPENIMKAFSEYMDFLDKQHKLDAQRAHYIMLMLIIQLIIFIIFVFINIYTLL
jgi:hypothetical protein